jgi:hypothetical protein
MWRFSRYHAQIGANIGIDIPRKFFKESKFATLNGGTSFQRSIKF